MVPHALREEPCEIAPCRHRKISDMPCHEVRRAEPQSLELAPGPWQVAQVADNEVQEVTHAPITDTQAKLLSVPCSRAMFR